MDNCPKRVDAADAEAPRPSWVETAVEFWSGVEAEEMTLEAVLRTYSSVKGHRTRCEKEIDYLLALLSARYSSISEERIKDCLENLERHTLRLADIKDYLVHLMYAKAKDHCQSMRARKRKRTHSQLHVHACRPELASTET